MTKSVRVGAESTKHNCKNTVKHNCLCKDMAKFLLWFPRLLYEHSVRKQHSIYTVLCFQKWNYREVCAGGRWETGYISLLWPNILYVELVEMPPSKILLLDKNGHQWFLFTIVVCSILNGSVKFSMYSQVPLTCVDNLWCKNHAGIVSSRPRGGLLT